MTLVKSSSFRQRKEVPCPVHTLLPPQPSAFVLPPRSDDGRLASPNSEAPPRLSMEMELPAVVQEGENSRVDPPGKARDDAPLLSDGPGNTRLLTVAAFAIDSQEGGRPSVVQSDEGGDTFAVPRREEVKWQDKGAEDEYPLLSRGVEDASSSDGKAEAHPRNGVMITSESLKEMEVKYAAYVRRDTYGTMGKKDISIWEKALLVLSLIIMVPIKLALLFFILITYYLICRICTLSGSPLEDKVQENYAHMTGLRRSIIVRSGRFLARALLFVLGFYTIKVTHGDSHRSESSDKDACMGNGIFHNSYEQPGAIISNHVSYLDILYHMSASFPSFVAKRSVGKLPLVGLISKCLGCVYVQREDKSSNFKGVSGVVTERLRAAHGDKIAPVMMLFPEGTTTNGGFLLPFKTGAFLAQTPVQPVILNYPYKRFSPAWDTISGVRHLILLLCQFINHLEVVWLPVYIPSEKEKSDPKLYADNVRTLMAREGGLTLSDIGLHEKRIYHAALNGLTAAEL